MHINDVYRLARWSLSGVLRYVMNYNYMFKFPIALPATPSKTRASLKEEHLLSHRLLIIWIHLMKPGKNIVVCHISQ